MKDHNLISKKRLNRLRQQGYKKQNDAELSKLAFGNRFAFIICTSLLLIGIGSQNITLLSVMLGIAFLGVILPYHPFDYIYNYIVVPNTKRPKLPRRSEQLKFACTMASLFIASIIFLFINNFNTAAYTVSAILLVIAVLVGTTDFCLPSIMYNRLFLKNKPRP